MPNIREYYQEAKQRLTPEGLAVSGTLALASLPGIPIIQSVLTLAINELSQAVPTDTIKIGSVLTILAVNGLSILRERKTLINEKYSTSPVASAVNIASGHPVLSSLAGHALNFTQSYTINPIHYFNATELMAGDDGRLLFENGAGVALALGLWNIGFNTLISNGHAVPFTGVLRSVGNSVVKKIKRS